MSLSLHPMPLTRHAAKMIPGNTERTGVASFPGISPLVAVAAALCVILAWSIWTIPTGLSNEARLVTITFALCIVGWTMTKIGDTLIALLAALVLVGAGTVTTDQFFKSLGTELVWLLIASFVIAAALKASGVSDRLVMAGVSGVKTTRGLFVSLTLIISATALVIPSTSGRAALLLPAFLVLSARIEDKGIVKALALLFPTVILLSAGGSLIGAGAHLVAVEYIQRLGGPRINYFGWLALAMPFALLTSFAAMELILRLFMTPPQRASGVLLAPTGATVEPWTSKQIRLIAVVSLIVIMWVLTPVHGIAAGVIAVGGALAATQPAMSPVSLKTALKSVEWEMIVFMAATLLLGNALLATNADEWTARRLLILLGNGAGDYSGLIVAIVAFIALAAHLLITSRTARVTVLIPAIVIPLSALGLDPSGLAMLTVMGTGFCQTMMASAKPVALFGKAETETYTAGDLARLSLWLFPVMMTALLAFALVIWPILGLPLIK